MHIPFVVGTLGGDILVAAEDNILVVVEDIPAVGEGIPVVHWGHNQEVLHNKIKIPLSNDCQNCI